ncbi:hypothetical protein ACH0BF_19495 [Pseudobacillus sp. 179-B 2D1 NHS]|uniref:hypothetical protein n=1 Tax=Pseudobacillus sp. 179-B 2D1 NHS TaxID=3374292 RepID=UPI003879DE75
MIVGAIYIYTSGAYSAWYTPWAAFFTALIFGLLLEVLRQSSPGDTKMMAVSAFLITGALPSVFFLHIGIGVVIFHLLLFILYTYGYLIVKIGPVNTLKEQINTVKTILMPGMPIDNTRIFDHFPGATTIMGGGLLYIAVSVLYIF